MLIKCASVEFLGAFGLVFFASTTRYFNDQDLLSVGLVLFFMVSALTYSFGNISGAHFNPFVTISLTITNQITFVNAVVYILFQVLGSIAAGALVYLVVRDKEGNDQNAIPAILENKRLISVVLETISMFILVYVYNSLHPSKKGPKYIYGVSFASVYLICIVAFGFISGGCLNVLFFFGPAIYLGFNKDVLFYCLGHLIGGVLAGGFYKLFMRKSVIDSDQVEDAGRMGRELKDKRD